MNIIDVLNEIKKRGSYLMTLTTLDKKKEDNNLNHYIFREGFPTDDIVPSLDKCVRMLNIIPPPRVNVNIPPKIMEQRKPLKIGILTHFNRAPEYYSPARAVRNQIKMLQSFGHEVVFFVQEGSKLDWGCEIRTIVPKFKREKGIVNLEVKNKFIETLKREITSDFDLMITHDLYIDDCITYREAIRECGVDIKWIHWARSGIGRPINFDMPNARYIYMNYADVGTFAHKIGVNPSRVRVCFNEKDPAVLWGWNPISMKVNEKLRLWEKDIIQTYPLCSTRMDAKGINSVIRVFGLLKQLGNKVALIVCNANSRKRVADIESKMNFAKECGLDENDILFTSNLKGLEYDVSRDVPHRTVVELMQISNLFIFPTLAEVCSNVLLEASMTKNLIVLNKDLNSLFDFTGEGMVLSYPFTSLNSVHYGGRENKDLMKLAEEISFIISSNMIDRQFRHVWKNHSFDSIYRNLLEPIIYE